MHTLFDKIYELYKDQFDLNEGLIKTHPIGISIPTIKSSLKGKDLVTTNKERNKIIINFINTPDKKYIDKIIKLMNNLGWFPAYIHALFEPKVGKKDLRYSDKVLKDLIDNEYSIIGFEFEAKFDIEVDIKFIPKKLYHVTPENKKDKILKIGLTPKTQSKLSKHPERVYLSEDIKSVIYMAHRLKIFSGFKKYILLKIDTGSIPAYFRLFRDPNFQPYGYYTLNNIPPYSLKVIKEFEV